MPPKKQQAAKAVSKKGAAKKKEEEQQHLPKRTKKEQQPPIEKMKDEEVDAPHDDAELEAESEPGPKAQAKPDANPDTKQTNGTSTNKKRKTAPTTSSPSASKTPRQGSRTSSRTTKSTTGASPRQLLNFLLSPHSLEYCYPPDELSFARSNPSPKSYSLTPPSRFSPWEHLLCASLLSKPLSHVLGMRSIRTLLNPPYSFNTPEATLKAGEKKIWDALEDARTQHRQKTAAYIYAMAQTYSSQEEDAMYNLSVEANDDGASGVVSFIKGSVKGMGQVGAELFARRIQCVDGWGDAVWPFADGKCMDSLRQLGLKVGDADELQDVLEREVDWEGVGAMGLNDVGKEAVEEKDMEIQVQVEFVVALERAVGCVLEGKVEEFRKAALG